MTKPKEDEQNYKFNVEIGNQNNVTTTKRNIIISMQDIP